MARPKTPYAPLIWTTLQTTATTGLVAVESTTDKPAHLLLTHSYQYPVRTPRFLTKYGRTRECGFFLRWASYRTTDQLEAGDSTSHTYVLSLPEIALSQWGAMAISSHPRPGEPATPPFPIPAKTAPIVHQHLILESTHIGQPRTLAPGASVTPPWETVALNIGSVPIPPLPATSVPITVTQMSRITAFVTASISGPCLVRMELIGIAAGPNNPELINYPGGPVQLGQTVTGTPGSLGTSAQLRVTNLGPNPLTLINAPYGLAELDMENP